MGGSQPGEITASRLGASGADVFSHSACTWSGSGLKNIRTEGESCMEKKSRVRLMGHGI